MGALIRHEFALNTTGTLRWVDITDRANTAYSISRGKQYERDQQQAGELEAVYRNDDGWLSPDNTASPFSPFVTLYRPIRVRAQYPPVANLLTTDQATAGEGTPIAPGSTASAVTGVSSTTVTATTIAASGSAFQGSQVYQTVLATSDVSGALLAEITGESAHPKPGVKYTFSAWVRNTSASTSAHVAAAITWYKADGVTVVSSATGTAATLSGGGAWTRITVAGTVPAGAATPVMAVKLTAGPAAACTVQADGLQWEQAAAASTFATPTWYPLFYGQVERWPGAWAGTGTVDGSGTMGVTNPTGVDALSGLAQVQLQDCYLNEVPTGTGITAPVYALYTLGDADGATTFVDASGSRPPATIVSGKYGPGMVTPGTDQTSTGASGGFVGYSGTVTNFTASDAPSDSPTQPCSALMIPAVTGLPLGPVGNASGLGWTRSLAFRLTTSLLPSGANAFLWLAISSVLTGAPLSGFTTFINGLMQPQMNLEVDGVVTALIHPDTVDVGNWHLLTFGVAVDGSFIWMSLDDGPSYEQPLSAAATSLGPYALDMIGVSLVQGNYQAFTMPWVGDLCLAVEWGAQVAFPASDLYQAWKTGFAGDTTGQRYQRILQWAGYQGASSIDAGTSTMGAAGDVSGSDALSACEGVVSAEKGNHAVTASGVLSFSARTDRFNQVVPVATFGEYDLAGEIPYAPATTDFDPTQLVNTAQITVSDGTSATDSAQPATAVNQASIDANYPRIMQATVNLDSTSQGYDLANWMVGAYGEPITRVSGLQVNLGANPALWPLVGPLDIGLLTRVNRRPTGAPALTWLQFIESLKWDVDPSTGDVLVTFEMTPAGRSAPALFTALHTTLHTAASSGVTALTLNALPDAATNPAACQLSPGMSLVLDPGLSTQETVTLATVATTTAGYTSVAVTLTAATTHAHAISAGVCQPLPAGVTDPTIYDLPRDQFGTAMFAY